MNRHRSWVIEYPRSYFLLKLLINESFDIRSHSEYPVSVFTLSVSEELDQARVS